MALYDYFLTHPFGQGPRTLVVIYVGLTGGGAFNLDGELTIGSPTDGTVCRFYIDTNTTASLWQLIASNHADDPANGWKRPLDYADALNQKVWKRLLSFGSGGGGGGTIPPTTNLLKGDGAGNAADSGKAISDLVLKQTSYATPNTENEIIACLQAAGLCA